MSKTPALPNERAAWVDSALRPLTGFYLWCKEVDRRIKAGAAALTDALPTKAGLSQIDFWCDHIVEVENGDIVVVQKALFAGTINSVVTDCASGTCTVTVKIEGAALGGTANSVSTTESQQDHSSDNTFAAGDTISYTVSSNSSCLGARVQINYTRALAA